MSSDLTRRIAFTLGALLVYRIGLHIPLPGIDSTAWEQIFRTQSGGILGTFAAGGIHRMAIFALGIMPYLSAAILIQLLMVVSPALQKLRKEGEKGRITINEYTRYLTVLLAAVQSYGLAIGLEGTHVVADPGFFFRITTVATLTGGAVFLIWLCDQITARGIGNGVALILFLGVVIDVPGDIFGAFEIVERGHSTAGLMLLMAVLTIAVTVGIVIIEQARRCVPIHFPRRQIGGRVIDEVSTHLPLKINNAGTIPITFGYLLILLPTTVRGYTGDHSPSWLIAFLDNFNHGQLGFMFYSAAIILALIFIYTAFVLDPAAAADTLKRHGGAIPGVEPGEATAAHIDWVAARITMLGAVYLAAVFLIPDILIRYAAVPFYLSGVSILVVVCTVLDIDSRVRGARTLGA